MDTHRRILIIGLGRFGTSVLRELWDAGREVMVLDRDPDVIERVKDTASAAFVGDATDRQVLAGLGVDEIETAVISFGSHFESTVLCLASLVELGASYVVARAETQRQVGILKQLGAARVLQLEQDMGERFADELITPVTRELLEVAEHYRVLPWSVSGPLVGNSLAEARLRQRYDINVIGYRRRGEGMPADTTPRLHIPTGDYVLAEGDSLLIVGEEDNVARFVEEVGD